MRSHLLNIASCLLSSASAGCSMGLDGPVPALSQRDPLSVAPAVVCSQISTVIDIRGQNFTPVVANVPGEPRLLLPSFSLERSAQLDGSRADRVTLVYNGDPEESANVSALRWLSEQHMQVTLDDQRLIDGERGGLPSGIYDARVLNPSGHESTASAALTVWDPPSFESNPIANLCMRQQRRVLVVRGEGFLEVDGALPKAMLAGKDAAVIGLHECEAESHAVRSCKELEIELPAGNPMSKEGEGATMLIVSNPAPPSCSVSASVQLRDLLQRDEDSVKPCLER